MFGLIPPGELNMMDLLKPDTKSNIADIRMRIIALV